MVDPDLEILDAPGEGDELPAELQQVETVVVGVAGPDSGPQCIAGPASVVLSRGRHKSLRSVGKPSYVLTC